MQTLVLKRSFAFVAALFTATLLLQLLVVQPVHAATVTWDGGGDGTTFADATNWVADVAPVADDDIVLDTDGLTDVTFDNDLTAGTQFGSITLSGTGSGSFTLTGNSVTLTGGLSNTATYNYVKFFVEVDITLNGDQAFNSDAKLVVGASGGTNTLDLGAFTMTKTGEYPLIVYSVVSGTGGVTVSGGDFVADKSNTFTGALVIETGGTLKGTGTVGDVTVNSGGAVAPGMSPGCLNTGDLTFTSGSTFTVEIDGPTVCTEYDQTAVTGAVDLGDATLDIQKLASYDPTVGGATFVIIDNDAADAVTGTFTGLVEGATAEVAGVSYVVSYVGGDGNDVTLAVADAPAAPDTGFGLSTVNYLLVLAFTAFATVGLVFTARKLKKINA